MPASKRRYANEDVVAGQMQSMLDMFAEVPRAKKRKKNDDSDSSSSSSSSDDMFQSKAAEKKGTPLYHLARALDNMLSQAGLGGLKTWIEEEPSCQMLGPHEFRYELKDLPPFGIILLRSGKDGVCTIWPRTNAVTKFQQLRGSTPAPCWSLLRTNAHRRSHYSRVSLTVLNCECGFSATPSIAYGMIASSDCRRRACGRTYMNVCIAKICRVGHSNRQLGGEKCRML